MPTYFSNCCRGHQHQGFQPSTRAPHFSTVWVSFNVTHPARVEVVEESNQIATLVLTINENDFNMDNTFLRFYRRD